jgi:uncharacterized protein YjbI with pentapeptide repeats
MIMRIKQLAMTGIITIALTQNVFADGVAQSVDTLEAQVASLTSIVYGLVEQQRCHARPDTLRVDSNGNYAGGVDWHGCDKSGLSMWGPQVDGAVTENLTNADLRNVNFTLANLIGIWAGGANLEGARFVNANLAYSDFTGAFVVTAEHAQQYGRAETVFINTNCPDESNSDDNGGTCAGHMTQESDLLIMLRKGLRPFFYKLRI